MLRLKKNAIDFSEYCMVKKKEILSSTGRDVGYFIPRMCHMYQGILGNGTFFKAHIRAFLNFQSRLKK